MSDLNSSVHDEQVSNTNSAADNTDPGTPAASEDAVTKASVNDLPAHEAEEFEQFFEEVEDDVELTEKAVPAVEAVETEETKSEESVNLALLSKEELISLLTNLLDTKPIESIINDVENIKINYYKKHKAEIERKRKAFVEQG